MTKTVIQNDEFYIRSRYKLHCEQGKQMISPEEVREGFTDTIGVGARRMSKSLLGKEEESAFWIKGRAWKKARET